MRGKNNNYSTSSNRMPPHQFFAGLVIYLTIWIGLTIIVGRALGIGQRTWSVGWCEVSEKQIKPVKNEQHRVSYVETVGFDNTTCKTKYSRIKSFGSAEEAEIWVKVHRGDVCWILDPPNCNQLVYRHFDPTYTTADLISAYNSLALVLMVIFLFVAMTIYVLVRMVQTKTINVCAVIGSEMC